VVEGHPVQDIILRVPGLPHLSLLPATQDLVGAELQLVERPFRESALRRVLEPIEGDYDYIIVDCPPSLGLLTLNVLAAVQTLIIPIQCEYYGLEGISQLLNTVRLVQQNINPGLAIGGVLLTMYDSRLNLCRQVAEDATEYFGPKVFGTPIPRNVRLAEAPSFGKPILLYDMQSVGAKSYLAVGQELMRRVEGDRAPTMPESAAPMEATPAPAEPSQATGSRLVDSQPSDSRPNGSEATGGPVGESQLSGTQSDQGKGAEDGAEPAVAAGEAVDPQLGEPHSSESASFESSFIESGSAESETPRPPESISRAESGHGGDSVQPSEAQPEVTR
jgi:chromosome partitioning protein